MTVIDNSPGGERVAGIRDYLRAVNANLVGIHEHHPDLGPSPTEYASHVGFLLDQIDALRNMLTLIGCRDSTWECERSTSGIGSCFDHGRTADAVYMDDRACPACVAHYALTGRAIPLGSGLSGQSTEKKLLPVQEWAAALYRLEWDADLYATPRGTYTEKYERRARRLLRSKALADCVARRTNTDLIDNLAAEVEEWRGLFDDATARVETLRTYAGPGPYEPSQFDGAKAPTWQELRDLADHNFRLYAHNDAEWREKYAVLRTEVAALREGKAEGFEEGLRLGLDAGLGVSEAAMGIRPDCPPVPVNPYRKQQS